MVATLAGIPSLLRLKSMILYFLLRAAADVANGDPAVHVSAAGFSSCETSSDFSGVVDVISSKAETDMNLLPGEVGLYFLIAIISNPP